jgi:ABC-type polysaccharide/polyol phosphate transport system ATPase subunit
MSDTVISVENLSKRYFVGHRAGERERYTALRDVIAREARNFTRKAVDAFCGRQIVQGDEVEEFWALKDVSFEVRRGEVIGIIGKNGAGKSTLLKIVSRITEPTEGRIRLRGRVASLLEVGTGFHPELTGRENIFLNGAILGMTRREIRSKFDEIVAFAEIERFLDTPVKHYSSGMYVRLAFAVAAHLEPEILIIDEVLAVGDAEFQKKCLGKMNEVSRMKGRTVLFVSHNMEAIIKLCHKAILIANGNIAAMGPISDVVATYHQHRSDPEVIELRDRDRPSWILGKAKFTKAQRVGVAPDWRLQFGDAIAFDLCIDSTAPMQSIELRVGLFSTRGFEVASWSSVYSQTAIALKAGANKLRVAFEDMTLLPGHYFLGMSLRSLRGTEDHLAEAISFEIVTTAKAASFDAQLLGGALIPKLSLVPLDLREDLTLSPAASMERP